MQVRVSLKKFVPDIEKKTGMVIIPHSVFDENGKQVGKVISFDINNDVLHLDVDDEFLRSDKVASFEIRGKIS